MEKLFKEELNKFKSLSYMLMPLDIQLFASGTIDGGKYNNYYSYYITWSSTPNIEKNYSDVTVNWIMKKTASDPYGAYNSTGTSKIILYINTIGTDEMKANFDLRSSAVGTTKVLATAKSQINHGSDGTKKLKIGGLHKTGLDWGNKEIYDHEVTLDTIPRASDLSATNGVIGSTATITLGKKLDSFTDSVTIIFGKITKYLKADGTLSDTEVKLATNGSINWTVPTSFYAQIPTEQSSEATIISTTYNGDTVVGTKTVTVDILTSDSSKAVISEFSVVDTNSATIALTGDANKIVKYLSKPKATLKATSNSNTTVKSFTIKNEDGSGVNGENTTGTLAVEYTFPNGVESGTFDASVVDGRNYITNATQLKKTLIEYIKLGFTKLEVKRTEPTSNTINANITGNWFNDSFGSVTNVLNNITWNYRESGASSWTSGGTLSLTKSGNTFSYSGTLGTTFDYQKSYDFQFIISDKAMTITTTGTVTKGQAVMLIGDEEVIINGDVTINGKLSVSTPFELDQIVDQNKRKLSAIFPLNLGILKYAEDLNDCKTAGQYGWQPSTLNSPYTAHGMDSYGLVITITSNYNPSATFLWAYQIAFGTSGGIYKRTNINQGVWSTWDEVQNDRVLYSNSNGSNGTITLGETTANFMYLEIFYRDNNGREYSSKRVPNPNGKSTDLGLIESASATQTYFRRTRYNISGTTMTPDLTTAGFARIENTSANHNDTPTNYIYITKVIGIKA